MPSDHEQGGIWQDIFKPGTPACALLCGLIGVAVAVSFLKIGFWKTALVVAFFAAGWYVGRSKKLRARAREIWRGAVHRDD